MGLVIRQRVEGLRKKGILIQPKGEIKVTPSDMITGQSIGTSAKTSFKSNWKVEAKREVKPHSQMKHIPVEKQTLKEPFLNPHQITVLPFSKSMHGFAVIQGADRAGRKEYGCVSRLDP